MGSRCGSSAVEGDSLHVDAEVGTEGMVAVALEDTAAHAATELGMEWNEMVVKS